MKCNSKKIVFRCDASSGIGWGHLIRDLAIVKKLKKNNEIIFASIKDPSNAQIKKQHLKIFFKKQKESEETFLERLKDALTPGVIVLDRKLPYRPSFLRKLGEGKIKIIVIDNYCKGMRAAEEIIFPTMHLDKNYLKKFLPESRAKKVKSGPEYVVLREELVKAKKKVRHKFSNFPNIVITTGGADPKGVLLKLIPWLKKMKLDAKITGLFGKSFKYQRKLEKIKKALPSNFNILPYSLKELTKSNIAICTFGVSIYEMIYLKIPTICMSHSLENASGAEILKKRHGVIDNLGYIDNIKFQDFKEAVKKLLTNKRHYMGLVKGCDNLIDGKAAERVAKLIEK